MPRKKNKRKAVEELESPDQEGAGLDSMESPDTIVTDFAALEIENLQSELDFILTARRSAQRTNRLSGIVSKLSTSNCSEALLGRTFSLSQLARREFKKCSSDTTPLLRLFQLTCATLLTDAEEFATNCYSEVQDLALKKEESYNNLAFQALAAAVTFSIVNENVIEDIFQWASRNCVSDSYSHDGPQVLLSALAVTVPERVSPLFPSFCSLVFSSTVEKQTSTATLLAVLGEHYITTHRREKIPKQCTENLNEILQQSHRRVQKDDRVSRKRHLSAVLATLEHGESPSETVIIDRDTLVLSSWKQLFVYSLVKSVLESGTLHMMTYNHNLREAFGLPPVLHAEEKSTPLPPMQKLEKVVRLKQHKKEVFQKRSSQRSKKEAALSLWED
ncbi:hypothetical protein P9112_007868 [Eukaryota sp. TZLM1-RC]